MISDTAAQQVSISMHHFFLNQCDYTGHMLIPITAALENLSSAKNLFKEKKKRVVDLKTTIFFV
jgi:hypothetical protein